jgi:trk system potassium uptake protein TrkH
MDDFGFKGALWAAVFHSISAFCNAGISIFPNGTIGMEQRPVLDMTFAILIIAGSFGFMTITELYERGTGGKPGRKTWSLHTRLVIFYTLIFIVIGTVGFMAMEYHNTLSGKPVAEQLMSSFFHSVSGRTAGFLNVDFALLENTTLYMFILFMFIGGSPASVAGGIKITTLAVIIGMAASRYRGLERVHIFNRAIPEEIVSRSISIVAIAMTIVIAFTTLLLFTESGAAASVQESRGLFIEVAFEVVSAFGTTGSSMGITPDLSVAGKLLVTLLMLIGRLGPITIAMVVTVRKSRASYQLSEEPVMVG